MKRRNFLQALTLIGGFAAFGKPDYAAALPTAPFSAANFDNDYQTNPFIQQLAIDPKLERYLERFNALCKALQSSASARNEYQINPINYLNSYGIDYEHDLDAEDRSMLNLLTDEHFRQLITQKRYTEIIARLNHEGILSDILGGKKAEIIKKIEANGEKIHTFLETQTLPVKLTADNSGSLYGNTYLLAEDSPSTRSLAVGPVSVVAAAAALYVAVVTIGAVELVGALHLVTATATFTSVSGGGGGGGGDGSSCEQCHAAYEPKNQSVVIKLSKAIDPCILSAYKKSETEAIIDTVLETVEKVIGHPLNDKERTLITNVALKPDVC